MPPNQIPHPTERAVEHRQELGLFGTTSTSATSYRQLQHPHLVVDSGSSCCLIGGFPNAGFRDIFSERHGNLIDGAGLVKLSPQGAVFFMSQYSRDQCGC